MAKRVLVVFGTRPEAIKVAPVVLQLRQSTHVQPVVCVTGQHRKMLDEVLELFDVKSDFDLNVMQDGQSLTGITTRVLDRLAPVIEEVDPDAVLVQGDTTSTFAGALSGFYHSVPVAHVEAGYRTGDLYRPFPEEANRRLVSEVARWHFAVNEDCRQHLLNEGHDAASISVVGNTGIDALFQVEQMPFDGVDVGVQRLLESPLRTVLMTMHRRENWGEPIESACRAARRLVDRNPDIQILFAVHLNPLVQESARSILGDVERVHLLPALDYHTFSKVLASSDMVMSDSGGVHEEALALGKPLLMLRDVSEWPDAVASGQTRLVGTKSDAIVATAEDVLVRLRAGLPLPRLKNPFADGNAAKRVVGLLEEYLG